MIQGTHHAKRIVATLLIAIFAIGLTLSCRQDTSTSETSADGTSASGGSAGATTAPSTTLVAGLHYPSAVKGRTDDDVTKMNATCVACHTTDGHNDSRSMHAETEAISCVDCHGGNWQIVGAAGVASLPTSDPRYIQVKDAAHVRPTHPELWPGSAHPKTPGAAVLAESADYIRFVNPGDLRAAQAACGSCHNQSKEDFIVDHVHKSMMATGPMLWEAALYNNGSINRKIPMFAESYDVNGRPRSVYPAARPAPEGSEEAELNPTPGQRITPTSRQIHDQGLIAALFPLPVWEISQPGNILRVFERGARSRPIIGIPDPMDNAGQPDVKLSLRGFGTDVRTDPVFLGLQKTRLLDPTLNLFGTNDHPGDYRGSGCTACHVMYANDREATQSGPWAKFGNRGQSFSTDPTINPSLPGSASTQPIIEPSNQPTTQYSDVQKTVKDGESGHPIRHIFLQDAPSATCIVCHIHPGTNVVNSYLGYQWWDNESDGEFMYPRKQKNPSAEDEAKVNAVNPEGTAPKGLWSNLYPEDDSFAGLKAGPDFLENVYRLNPLLKFVQFGDFHGHGWVFRKVYRQSRDGTLLDRDGNAIAANDPKKFDLAVHLKDIHLEKGMSCVDCHFTQDVHGDANLYGETRNAVMVQCVDCHGTSEKPAVISQYFTEQAGDANDDKLKDYRMHAFSGNSAFAGLDKDKDSQFIQDRNSGIIATHFENKLDDQGRLVQKSAVYASYVKELQQQGKSADDADAQAQAEGMVKEWPIISALEPITASPFVPGDLATRTDPAADQQKVLRARRALYAHTVRAEFDKNGNPIWGGTPGPNDKHRLAHSDSRMSCYACHSAWNTSCFGCHLPMKANEYKPNLHNEGTTSRNWTNYNFQTLRDDIYMLGIDSTVKDHKVVPVRSACAVMVSSQDANRQWIYQQQQTVSGQGFAGTAFSPYFPHTVRAAETKQCEDCHLSAKNDNNAIISQLLMQGTHAVNFIGRFAWVAEGNNGLQAVAVTELDEPQAVIGSKLHSLAYPDNFQEHLKNNLQLSESYEHRGTVLDVQLRGEYLYAACGENGFIAYDVANINNKGFSQRIITAPVSMFGQRFYVKSKYATSICSPSTMAIDPTRARLPENDEGVITEPGSRRPIAQAPIPALYAYLYLTDAQEGLIVIGNPPGQGPPGVSTLLDGDPDNNFLRRATPAFNPGGLLDGARQMVLRGRYAYICCNAGIVVLDMTDPLNPRHVTTIAQGIREARKITVQFRYAFVCDADGVKVMDITYPEAPRLVPAATIPIADARDIYVCRTYGYVAAGSEGMAVIDLTNPERPGAPVMYNPYSALTGARAVRIGMTNASLYAYVAAGDRGLAVLQLTGADAETPGYLGFSPKPAPRVIALFKTNGPALGLSTGLDRDRAVDEDGNQLTVFGRRGSRPFDLPEQQRLYFTRPPTSPDDQPPVYRVSNDPMTDPLPAASQPAAPAQ